MLGYMAPELLLGTAADKRADIFALGIMLVEAFSGVRPFSGQTQGEMLQSILNQTVYLPEEIGRSSLLQLALLRCLKSDIDATYQTILEAEAEILPAIHTL